MNMSEEISALIKPSSEEVSRVFSVREELLQKIGCTFSSNPTYKSVKVIGSAATGNFLKGQRDIDIVVIASDSSDCLDLSCLSKRPEFKECSANRLSRIVAQKLNMKYRDFNVSIGLVYENGPRERSLSWDMLQHPEFTLERLGDMQRDDVLLAKQLFRNIGLYGANVGGFACEQMICWYKDIEGLLEVLESGRVFIDYSGRYVRNSEPMIVTYPFCGLDNLTASVTESAVRQVSNYVKAIGANPEKFNIDTRRCVNKTFWKKRASKYSGSPQMCGPDLKLSSIENSTFRRCLQQIPHRRVLDIGCGNGFSTQAICHGLGSMVSAVDLDKQMICEAMSSAYNVSDLDVEYLCADVCALPFPDNSFDVVYCKRTIVNLASVDEQRKAISEAARVLKPGGRLLMLELTKEGFDRLNRLGTILGLREQEIPFHNLLISNDFISVDVRAHFNIIKRRDPVSTYRLATQIAIPLLNKLHLSVFKGLVYMLGVRISRPLIRLEVEAFIEATPK